MFGRLTWRCHESYRSGLSHEPRKSEAAATLAYKGKTYYFCSKPCKEDFAKNPEPYLGDKTAVEEAGAKEKIVAYTCPMHPEIRHPGPGFCPKCGMALEPVTPSEPLTKAEWTCPMHSEIIRVAPGSCPICGMALEPKTITAEEEENPELINMTRRFKVSVVLTVPLVFIAMRHYIPGLTAIDRIIPAGIMKWFELILAAPVVLWVAFTYQSTLIYVLTRGDARLLICGQH